MFVGTIELNPAHMDCYRDLRSNIFIKQQETFPKITRLAMLGGNFFVSNNIFF